ncbi:thioesterase family protein [Arthrobacter sp. CAN_C5]|uniref:acyl-CoA thioesterase n=1 Tax=Arthrobacter sp. CAN_C5 TaxID=2760706 RepID=UPI00247AED2A|nr:acyl-CoA thioesterase [Arthrobacter sp. CAN_C5]
MPNDLDLLGHMNNGRYLSILDIGRIDLLVRSGFWRKMTTAGWYPVVAAQTITYRKSLRLGQQFDVFTRIIGLHDRWVFIEQTFRRGDAIYAQAVIRTRFLKEGGGTVSLEELNTLAGCPPDDLLLPEWVERWTTDSRVLAETP